MRDCHAAFVWNVCFVPIAVLGQHSMVAMGLALIFAMIETNQHVTQGGFPEQLTALSKLRELELTSMGPGAAVSLPNSISNWGELRDLQLYRCGFEKLPESISALSKLDTLLMEGFRYFHGFCVQAWVTVVYGITTLL